MHDPCGFWYQWNWLKGKSWMTDVRKVIEQRTQQAADTFRRTLEAAMTGDMNVAGIGIRCTTDKQNKRVGRPMIVVEHATRWTHKPRENARTFEALT